LENQTLVAGNISKLGWKISLDYAIKFMAGLNMTLLSSKIYQQRL
jgi:hypothetical protein